jgi:ribosomal-protein-alanine N-acetyltransferase
MTFTLRPMVADDLGAALALAASCPEAPQWPASSYAAYLDPALHPPLLRAAFIAHSGPQLKGFAAATLLLDGLENRCDLDTLAVHPTARRQGIGAALVQGVLAWASRHGAARLTLEVRAANASALRLYERLGFHRQGLRPRYYAHPQDDAVLLALPVTSVSKVPPFSTDKDIEGGPPRC